VPPQPSKQGNLGRTQEADREEAHHAVRTEGIFPANFGEAEVKVLAVEPKKVLAMSKLSSIERHRALMWSFALAMLASLGFALIASQPAAAQLPPICEEYPDLPQCELPDEEEPPGDNDGNNGGNGGTGDTDGNLPFTGYPLTPLLMLAIVLLATALAIRGYIAIRKRLSTERGPTSYL
jgi:hypothetical protein